MTELPPNTARFSLCGTWRYDLTRELGGPLTLLSIGLNPSKATATKDDPTIRKDCGFARRWGLGRVWKLNASAYCATDPDVMKQAAKDGIDIVGPDNDRTILEALAIVHAAGGKVVVSWGRHIDPARQVRMAELLDSVPGVVPWCFGTNLNGSPKHELYQKWVTPLVPWHCP